METEIQKEGRCPGRISTSAPGLSLNIPSSVLPPAGHLITCRLHACAEIGVARRGSRPPAQGGWAVTVPLTQLPPPKDPTSRFSIGATFPEVSPGGPARIKFTQTPFGPNKIRCPRQVGRRAVAGSLCVDVGARFGAEEEFPDSGRTGREVCGGLLLMASRPQHLGQGLTRQRCSYIF